MKNNIGVIGGAFDPVHTGHLIIAQFLLDELALKRVLFTPSLNPPHKKPATPFDHRYRMSVLGTNDNDKLQVSEIEKEVGGVSYTKKIIEALKKEIDGDFYLIIGADQYREIKTWHKPEVLADMVTLVVVARPGYRIEDDLPLRDRIITPKTPLIDISSTSIRERVRQGKSIRYLVPDQVIGYIKSQGLYR